MSAAADSNPPGELYCATCEKMFVAGERCPTDGSRLIKLKVPIDPLLGRELDGRYTVLERLGQGGMGAVYRGEQHSVGREVAIKVVHNGLVHDPEVIKRFLREAKLASQLAHPNAVAVLDFGQTEDGVSYLVMELVRGRTLDDAIRDDGVFRPERVVRIGTQILDALDAAHNRSIIHRDLKPANVMLLSHGRDLVKVLDFGLAKSVAPDATSATMTNAGQIVGTPSFMPPELATGQSCDGRADLYSLGCILYLLGSGRLPFVSESVNELIAMHGCDDPAPPMPGVSPQLAMVVAKLLEKKPERRYQTAAEALHALENLSTNTPAAGIPTWSDPYADRSGPALNGHGRLETPYPPSLFGSPGAPGHGETLLGNAAPAQTLSVTPTARRRWPFVLGGLGAVVLAAAVVVVVAGSSKQDAVEPTGERDQPTVELTPTTTQPTTTAITPTTSEPTTPTTTAGAGSGSAVDPTTTTVPDEPTTPTTTTPTTPTPTTPTPTTPTPTTTKPTKPTTTKTTTKPTTSTTKPEKPVKPVTEKPVTEKPVTEKPVTEKPTKPGTATPF